MLEALSVSRTAAHREVQRARALLLAADGVANIRIASEVGVTAMRLRSWRIRFEIQGLAKFARVAPGRGRKSTIPQEVVEEIVGLTQNSTSEGETHWSTQTMAKRVGVSKDTVQRVWSARGLKPHLVKTFKLSNDPRFEEKLIDVVGLYLNPPEQAIVLCMEAFLEWSVREREPYDDFLATTVNRPGFEPWQFRVVADASGQIVGTALVVMSGNSGTEAFIDRLAVHRDQRRQGVGQALLVDAFARGRDTARLARRSRLTHAPAR